MGTAPILCANAHTGWRLVPNAIRGRLNKFPNDCDARNARSIDEVIQTCPW